MILLLNPIREDNRMAQGQPSFFVVRDISLQDLHPRIALAPVDDKPYSQAEKGFKRSYSYQIRKG